MWRRRIFQPTPWCVTLKQVAKGAKIRLDGDPDPVIPEADQRIEYDDTEPDLTDMLKSMMYHVMKGTLTEAGAWNDEQKRNGCDKAEHVSFRYLRNP